MKPREIELHIEELVLHGFDPATRWSVGDGLENEMRHLLAQQGVPENWLTNPDRIRPAAISLARLTTPVATGAEIARATFEGGGR